MIGHSPSKVLRRTFGCVVVAIGLAACGGSSGPAPTLPADVGLAVKAVPSLRFDASSYTAKAGDVVVGYLNEDSVRHTLIIAKDGTKVADFKIVVPRKNTVDSATVKLAAGEYTLLCDVPGHQNMKATLTVE